jgi:hypothetical protein
MFSCELAESKQKLIPLNGIDSNSMRSIIEYAYTSQLIIHDNNVQSLLQSANLFDIKPIKDACSHYMEWHIDESNCIGIHCFSEKYDCFKLKATSFNFILANFCKVSKIIFKDIFWSEFIHFLLKKVILCDEFLNLHKSKLIEIISDDNLNVPNEDIVFNACMKWLDHAPDTRSDQFYQV